MSGIHEAIPRIIGDMPAIGKDSLNKIQNFKYRSIDAIYNEVSTVMAKHGVFTVPTVLEDRCEERQAKSGGLLIARVLKIVYRFFASDGSFIDATVLAESCDSGDKAASKAMAIGHKYALLQVFCIGTEESKDPDAHSYELARLPPIETPAPTITQYQSKWDPEARKALSQALNDHRAPKELWHAISELCYGKTSADWDEIISRALAFQAAQQ